MANIGANHRGETIGNHNCLKTVFRLARYIYIRGSDRMMLIQCDRSRTLGC